MAKLTHGDGPFPYKIGRGEGETDVGTPLEHYPNIAMRIGIFLAYFAMAETMTPFLLMSVVSLSEREAKTVLGMHQSYNARLEMIERLLTNNKDSAYPHGRIVRAIAKELRWLNSIRNQYAHSLYGAGRSPSSVMLFPFHADAKSRKITELEIDEEDVALHTVRAKRLLCAMGEFVDLLYQQSDRDRLEA